MTMRLFELRNNLQKMSLSDFKHELSQQHSLTAPDFSHLAQSAYEHKRADFLLYFLALYPYSSSIVDVEVGNRPLFFQIVSTGTLHEVQTIMQTHKDIDYLTRKGQALAHVLENPRRKEDAAQTLDIFSHILSLKPEYANYRRNNPLLVEALEREQFEVALLLIERGASCQSLSENGDNLLHILMRNYSKASQKQVLEIRARLMERGVDENKKNVNGKRALEYCPEVMKKVEEGRPGRKKGKGQNSNLLSFNDEEHKKGKGKSEEGWDTTRNQGNEEKLAKDDGVVELKLDSKSDQIQIERQANLIIEKFTSEKEKELRRKKMEKGRERERPFKNRVMTPDELKFYLEEDIQYETEIISNQNNEQRTFLKELVEKIAAKIGAGVGAEVEIFGSFATELCLPESDIDMVVRSQKSANSFWLLQNIYYLLNEMKEEIESAKFIKTASMPIIKIHCTQKYHEKKIDITYQDENHNGLQAVELIQQYLHIYPQLRPLTFILKKFIYSARLFDPYSGGISSYGLILMIVAYLQNDNRDRKKNNKTKAEPPMISEILIGFLRFYGFKCNYIGKRICVLRPERARMEMEAKTLDASLEPIYLTVMDMDQIYNNDWQPRAKLVILDPLNENNNIGRATHKIREIRTTFEMAYVCIHTNKNCAGKKTCESYRRIRDNVQPSMRYEENRRPCCIIKRMLHSANTILIS